MESKFAKIRSELTELGYTQNFSIDSLNLVNRLLADLKTTTLSLKKYKKIAEEALEERDNLALGAEPYKCDNAKLIKECNELHLSFLQFKEQNEKTQRDLKRQINKLESEREEADIEKERLRKRIKSLEIDLVEQGSVKDTKKPGRSKSTSSTNDITKAMVMSDTKIKNLTKEVKELKEQKLKLLDRLKSYESQIENRDKEIERLMGLVEGGRPLKALNQDCCNKDIDNRCRALHDHIHKLKEENNILQNNFKDAISKQHEAMRRALHLAERNKQLEKELKDIDQIALAVEAECNDAVKNKSDTVARLQDRINESVISIQNLERENARLRQDKTELSSDLDAIKLEKSHLQKLLEKEVEDRKGLMDRVNNFTIIEHDLNMEIDRLVRLSGEQKRRIAELENVISSEKLKTFEFIPEAYKVASKEKGQQTDKASKPSGSSKAPTSPIKSRTVPIKGQTSPTKLKTGQHKLTCKKSLNQATSSSSLTERVKSKELTVKNEGYCGSDRCLKFMRELLDKEIDHRQAQTLQMMETLKQEKEYYMKEYLRLMDELKNKPSPSVLMRKLEESEANVQYLKNAYGGKSSATFVESDYDSSRSLLNQTIKRKEREIELLRADLQRSEEECENFRKKYQNLVADTDVERARIKELLADMEKHINKLEDERRDLVIAQGTHRSSLNQMEDSQKTLRDQLRSTQEELNIAKANYNQLKNLHDQSDRTIADLQNKLLRTETELSSLKQQLKSTDKQKNVSEVEIATLNGDIQVMRSQLCNLDKEKDDLLNDLDAKTEKLALLEEQLKSKNKIISTLEAERNELKRKVCKYEDESLNKEGDLRSSRHELKAVQSELDSERKTKDSLLRENRRLQEEIACVTTDCKDARNELDRLHMQVDDLKRQLQIYVAEIKRTEDLISQKEVERNELLDQFKNLSQEAVVLESNNHTLENEATQNRVQLSVALDHAADLEHRLEDKEAIIKGYEKQIATLTSQLAYYEMQTKQKEGSEDRLTEEARQMRELCVKMDQEKDNLQRDMLRRDEEIIKIQRALDKLRIENKELQGRLNKDHDNTEGLEKLLTEARQDIIQQKLENQDLQMEITRLKSDIANLQERLATANEQLDIYQDKALDYSQQNKQLRREIANERFTRARDDDSRRYPSL